MTDNYTQFSLKDVMEMMQTGFKETNANLAELSNHLSNRITCVEATQLHMQSSIDNINTTLGDKVSVVHERIDKQNDRLVELEKSTASWTAIPTLVGILGGISTVCMFLYIIYK